MTESLLVERPRPGIVLLTLNRPHVLNALDRELLAAIRDALAEVGRDHEVGCAVLTGAGRAFCAGADLKAIRGMTPAQFRELAEAFRDVAFGVRALGKPIVAAVNGYALAGGFELAAVCDFRLVAADAKLGVADADINMSPTSGLTWLLPRLVGLGWAKYLALACPLVDGTKAFEIGLAQEALPAGELLPRALDVAEAIARKPPLGVRLTRLGLDLGAESSYDAAVAYELELEDVGFVHPDTREAMAAFVEKRTPVFRRSAGE
jgi:enoyl-CoA hydratase/carnithine racemase